MADFLRQPKADAPKPREMQDGESFTDIKDGECIAQKAKLDGDKFVCLEVRKSVRNKDGSRLSADDRKKVVDACKAEVEKKWENYKTPAPKKAAPNKKATAKKAPAKTTTKKAGGTKKK